MRRSAPSRRNRLRRHARRSTRRRPSSIRLRAEAQQEKEQKVGNKHAHLAITHLREHLNAEQLAEFFALVERPNCTDCWNELGKALAGQLEIGKLLEEREAATDSDGKAKQAASLSEEEAPHVAA